MAIDITTSGNYIIFTSDDFTPNKEQRYPKKEVRYGRSDVNDQTYVVYHNNSSINGLIEVLWSDFTNDSVAFATQEEFETLLDDETGVQGSGGGSTTQNGFIDYNDATGTISLTADTWTDIPNDGAGAFSNSLYKPTGVTELLDTTTGYIDVSELDLGDTILIRNDYSVNPNTNNSLLEFRYELGTGLGTYTLEKIVGRLDSGSGQNYRFSLEPDLIYMGDTNTRDNDIKLQVKLSTDGTLTNAGSVIQVIKR